MTKQEFRQLLDRLASGWARRDYAAVAQEFSEDVRYGDPTRYSFNNRRDLQAFFENDEGYEQRTVWHTVIFDEAQQIGAAEYTYEGTHRYHGMVLIRVEDGRITNWREYQHINDKPWEEFVAATMFN
jgi:ketosteroid isomerase-like protein